MQGWIGKKDKWVRKFDVEIETGKGNELGSSEYDDLFRELESASLEGAGWVLSKSGQWIHESAANVKMHLQSRGLAKPEAEEVMGEAVGKAWRLVNLPFREEYPGGRQWNMDAAQRVFEPAVLGDDERPHHPHWDKVLNHIGQDLNAGLREALWSQKAGIKTGAQYLLCWIACLFKYPFQPLPYLFLYGPENNGKSIFHESIALLMTKGYIPAEWAYTAHQRFQR